jgi:hypothetical protein
VSGALKVDEGSVDIQSNTGSALGDDVVIVGRPRPPPASAKRFGSIPFGVDLDVDLGPRLLVTGEGLETRAAGKVRVHAVPDGTLSARASSAPSTAPIRVRPAPVRRARPPDLRRADRQPGARHRRLAQEPAGRGRRRVTGTARCRASN